MEYLFLILIIEILLQLKSKQGDITAAFIHEKLEENEKVFVEIPKYFYQYDKWGKKRVLSLKKTLYGLCQRPRYFCKYLTQKLITSGMIQSNLDPFLFIGDKVICIVYVDDLIFWAKDESDMNCSSPRRTFFLHALSFECTSKLCDTFINQFLVHFHI